MKIGNQKKSFDSIVNRDGAIPFSIGRASSFNFNNEAQAGLAMSAAITGIRPICAMSLGEISASVLKFSGEQKVLNFSKKPCKAIRHGF